MLLVPHMLILCWGFLIVNRAVKKLVLNLDWQRYQFMKEPPNRHYSLLGGRFAGLPSRRHQRHVDILATILQHTSRPAPDPRAAAEASSSIIRSPPCLQPRHHLDHPKHRCNGRQ